MIGTNKGLYLHNRMYYNTDDYVTATNGDVLDINLRGLGNYVNMLHINFNVSVGDKLGQAIVIVGKLSNLSTAAIRYLLMMKENNFNCIGHLLANNYKAVYDVSDAVYYRALNELIDKGFVSKIIEGKITINPFYRKLIDSFTPHDDNNSVVVLNL